MAVNKFVTPWSTDSRHGSTPVPEVHLVLPIRENALLSKYCQYATTNLVEMSCSVSKKHKFIRRKYKIGTSDVYVRDHYLHVFLYMEYQLH